MFASLIKYLDQVNISNTFTSGMQDDLQLYGNELDLIITCWTVGYVIGEIPAQVPAISQVHNRLKEHTR